MAFFFDKDANMRVGRWLKLRGHSLTSTSEQHWDEYEDRELLMLAGSQSLVFVTHNERDFVHLHGMGAVQHGGILVLPQVPAADVDVVAAAVDQLVNPRRSGFTALTNTLYRFRMSSGWQRWDDEQHWVQVEN